MLKLKLQYCCHLMWRLTHLKRPLSWERLKAGVEADNRGSDGCMALPTQWTWVWVNSRSWWWTGWPGVLLVYGVSKSLIQLRDWTALTNFSIIVVNYLLPISLLIITCHNCITLLYPIPPYSPVYLKYKNVYIGEYTLCA